MQSQRQFYVLYYFTELEYGTVVLFHEIPYLSGKSLHCVCAFCIENGHSLSVNSASSDANEFCCIRSQEMPVYKHSAISLTASASEL